MGDRKISIIVPVFNSLKHLKVCLDSILAAARSYGDAELIVVDNGSTDGSYELLLSDYRETARITREKDVTIAALRNLGAQLANGQFLSFIDSDFLVPRDYFHRAMSVFESVDADALVCKLALPPSPHWIEETWDNLHFHPYEGPTLLYGGTFIIKRSAFERVGGFNPMLITNEDRELGTRLNQAGYKIYESNQFAAIHLGEPRTLREFFRRQLWHGLGLLTSPGVSKLNKPVIMTLAHLLLSVLGVAALIVGRGGIVARIASFLILSAAAPLTTVLYRYAKLRRVYRPLRCLLLYYLYFTARAWALFKLLPARIRRGKRPSRFSPRSSR